LSDYSDDLRRKIASSAERGIPEAQADRIYSVRLSSVKRYVNKAHWGESLATKNRLGFAPKPHGNDKPMKLFDGVHNERPFASLQGNIS
jgi:hypothetical protein